MAVLVAILEDDPARITEMRACLAEVLPGAEVISFEASEAMIHWLGEHLGDVVLISLDHDLPLREKDGEVIDCGTGRQVADFLTALTPTCPLVVHSSNDPCASGMFFALRDGGWTVSRVYPRDEQRWVRDAWAEQIQRYVREGWIQVAGM